jgi:hypothetical protein
MGRQNAAKGVKASALLNGAEALRLDGNDLQHVNE